MGTTGRTILTLSLSSTATRFSFLHIPKTYKPISPLYLKRVYLGFRPLCSNTSIATNPSVNEAIEPMKHSILLERLRVRHLKDSTKTPQSRSGQESGGVSEGGKVGKKGSENGGKVVNFGELGLSDEVIGALVEMGISVPTEIQCIGVPVVLEEKSVVLGSHTGSGKTLAYMLPLAQLLRRDEALYGMLMKPRRPRAVVLCPTRELSEQVFRVAKSVSHHARFRCTMVSGGGRLRPQEDSLNGPIDMVVGTPGRVLQHIEEGNIVYGDIKYVVLDEADTMFDRGFGPDIRKFLGPLKNRASKPGGLDFQTVLVTATMTQAVQKLVDEEFQGILHVRTSTLHKKIALARHDFIKLSGAENKLEALLQVLEPSLAKGNRVMVFCNTLNSSRAVDHFLSENQISTVNYHGEVPAEQRVENLKKFKSDDGDCPTLVCTDLAARGLDLDVDHVIMFDFPLTSIDYLHRTGRTARMGAKGKVTSLIAKKDHSLATRIEEAIMKNESLESLTVDYIKRDTARSKISQNTVKNAKLIKVSSRGKKAVSGKSASVHGKAGSTRASGSNSGRASSTIKSKRGATKVSRPLKSSNTSNSRGPVSGGKKQSSGFKVSKPVKSSTVSSNRGPATGGKKQTGSGKSSAVKSTSKLNVVGFRGRSSSSNKSGPFRAS
ncbi:hypothetical protein DCAR_0101247 [Daucus carota subsp. sativus]|uniref:Uncharacterized protein n=1 Tax=Daucus carota subsp. sativus TaxID=79200 RepID=A0A162AC97_DAUCS|nr:PREDICTED: DEAD-box ATP-dependent RNA helicase 39 [Daucus carota subsp. sativus]WOG82086.1 hypothetical protein DCAR_0101247 [Daucus carota subsp. sativus]